MEVTQSVFAYGDEKLESIPTRFQLLRGWALCTRRWLRSRHKSKTKARLCKRAMLSHTCDVLAGGEQDQQCLWLLPPCVQQSMQSRVEDERVCLDLSMSFAIRLASCTQQDSLESLSCQARCYCCIVELHRRMQVL
eukprot:6479347-Amphidinium_carterae.1